MTVIAGIALAGEVALAADGYSSYGALSEPVEKLREVRGIAFAASGWALVSDLFEEWLEDLSSFELWEKDQALVLEPSSWGRSEWAKRWRRFHADAAPDVRLNPSGKDSDGDDTPATHLDTTVIVASPAGLFRLEPCGTVREYGPGSPSGSWVVTGAGQEAAAGALFAAGRVVSTGAIGPGEVVNLAELAVEAACAVTSGLKSGSVQSAFFRVAP